CAWPWPGLPRDRGGWCRPAFVPEARRDPGGLHRAATSSFGLLVRFDQLQERAAEGLGMEEGDFVPARAWPRDLVDERHASGAQAGEQRVQVLDAQREVVERVAALLQELLEPLVALGRDQLERGAIGEVEEGGVHLLRGDEFPVGDLLAEELLDQGDDGADVA